MTIPIWMLLAFAVWTIVVCQSITHIALVQTNVVAAIRFLFFFAQIACFLGIASVIVQGV